MTPTFKMNTENMQRVMQALRRHLDAEIERVETEIARLSAVRNTSNNSNDSFISLTRNEISRSFNVPEDCVSVDSFQTADDSSHSSSQFGASALPSVSMSPPPP